MTDIFLSYAREDFVKAKGLAQVFESRGWKVFWDFKIQPGSTWRKDIGTHLNAARCVVVLWSEASINSNFVADEAQVGVDKRVLIPALIQAVQPPLGFQQFQTADLTRWDGSASSNDLASLILVLEGILDAKTSVPPPPEPPDRPKLEDRLSSHGQLALLGLPGGTFIMGSPGYETGRNPSEGPCREVTVKPFYLSKYAVSNANYRRFLEANPDIRPPHYWNDSRFNQPEQPVVGVSWDEARRFALWAGGRLPTEAEWEYAARAGTTTRYSWGDDIEPDRANFRNGKSSGAKLVAVDEYDPNPWGLHQMHGNVYEWVADRWQENYATTAAMKDTTPGGERVIRGGSWINKPIYLRSSARDRFAADEVLPSIGFRLAQDQHELEMSKSG